MELALALEESDLQALQSSLTTFVQTHLPLGRAMGIDVHQFTGFDGADGHSLALSAPLALNDNDKDTAFGGSLYCVAVMTCWSFVYLRCVHQQRLNPALPRGTPKIVVSKAQIEYLAPVKSEPIVAYCDEVESALWTPFFDRFDSHGSARINLSSQVSTQSDGGGKPAVSFSGAYSLIGFY